MSKERSSVWEIVIRDIIIALLVAIIAGVIVSKISGDWSFGNPKPGPTSTTTPPSEAGPESDPTTLTKTFYGDKADGEALYRFCTSDWLTCRNAAVGNAQWEGLLVSTIGAGYYPENSDFIIERAFLFFDTTEIPIDATITSVSLYLYAGGEYQNGNKTVHVVPSQAGIPLSQYDYSRVEFISGGSVTFSAPFTWESIEFNQASLDWITKSGMSRLALVQDNDLRNIEPTTRHDLLISTAEDDPHAPYLVITYNLP